MLSSRYQERRDRLLLLVGLSDQEKLFIQQHHKNNPVARRVAALICDYMDSDDSCRCKELVGLLLEDVIPELRSVIVAHSMELPDGYCLVTVQHLEALQNLAVQGIRVNCLRGQDRHMAVHAMGDACAVVMNLDTQVAAAVEPQRIREAG